MEKEVSAGQLIAGKYRVEQVLGRGGMGVVMSALHEHLNQRVALKFLTDNAYLQPEAVARFVREARAAVQIQSEHVARVMDVGTLESGAPYMVMEYLRGRDLKDVSTRRGALPVTEAVDYVLQACDAVAEAHSLGIVHRDLKPSNLFLTERPDGSPLVKVLDFGISKALHSGETSQMQMTASAAIMGSPQYMSPEQIRSSKNVDARADVWALGTILHELLTGAPAYVADTVPGLLAMIVADSPPPLCASRPDAPKDLEAAILRCLEKDRERRFANVSEFARSLERFASNETKPLIRRIARVLGDDSAQSHGMGRSVPIGNTFQESVGQTNGTWSRTGRLSDAGAPPPVYARPTVQFGAGLGLVSLCLLGWFLFRSAPADNGTSDVSPAAASVPPAPEARHDLPSLPPVTLPRQNEGSIGSLPSISPSVVRPVREEPMVAEPPVLEDSDESALDEAPVRHAVRTPKTTGRIKAASLGTVRHERPRSSGAETTTRPRIESDEPAPPVATPKKNNTLDLFDDTK